MEKKVITRSMVKSSPSAAHEDFLPPSHVILPGEDMKHYAHIEDQIIQSVIPKDIIERFWCRDIADLVWETLRLRRMKGNLYVAATPKGLKKVLGDRMRLPNLEDFVSEWSLGDQFACELVDKHLNKLKISMDVVRAEGLAARLPDIERIDRLIASTESRRNIVLREIGRHRDALAARLDRASATILDAEFAEVQSTNQQRPMKDGKQS